MCVFRKKRFAGIILEKVSFQMSDVEINIPNNALVELVASNEPRNNEVQDIAPPTQEELDRAIRICELSDPIRIVIPPTQSTNSPSWD